MEGLSSGHGEGCWLDRRMGVVLGALEVTRSRGAGPLWGRVLLYRRRPLIVGAGWPCMHTVMCAGDLHE